MVLVGCQVSVLCLRRKYSSSFSFFPPSIFSLLQGIFSLDVLGWLHAGWIGICTVKIYHTQWICNNIVTVACAGLNICFHVVQILLLRFLYCIMCVSLSTFCIWTETRLCFSWSLCISFSNLMVSDKTLLLLIPFWLGIYRKNRWKKGLKWFSRLAVVSLHDQVIFNVALHFPYCQSANISILFYLLLCQFIKQVILKSMSYLV